MQTHIYIETSIPSFYYTERTDAEAVARKHWTKQWWAENTQQVLLTSSVIVLEELREGTGSRVPQRLALLDNITILSITPEVTEIAQIYIDKLVMPKEPTGDAFHLAIASFHKVDALLTWNCKHLANANKFNQIRRINFELGLPCPILATPLNFLEGED